MKKSVISGTGVPLNYIDAEAETDYARSLAMQNNGFVRKVVNYQKSFGAFFTEVLQRLYYLEYKDYKSQDETELNNKISAIEAYFPAPVFLNLGNINEQVSAVQQMVDFLAPLEVPEDAEEEDNAKLNRLFKKELIKQEFMNSLDFEKYEDILEQIKKKMDQDKKEEELFNSDDQDDAFGGGTESEDSEGEF